MIDSEMMTEVMSGEFSPEEYSKEDRNDMVEYMAVFGGFVMLVNRFWEGLHPDALPYEIEQTEANLIVRCGVFEGSPLKTEMTEGPFEKMYAHAFLQDFVTDMEASFKVAAE